MMDWLQLCEDDQLRLERLRSRRKPEWFKKARLGIMIHWTPANVPAWAPVGADIAEVVRAKPEESAIYSPYAEWYWNAQRIPGSPTALHHAATYGDAPYEDFVAQWRSTAEHLDIGNWADAVAATGARYAVLVTKHHDGVLLWPSTTRNPHRSGWQTTRDLVGEFSSALRARGIKIGLYYSGGLDWTFEAGPSRNLGEALATVPVSEAYHCYVANHYRELIERYRPDYLWNDIAMPAQAGLLELFEQYCAACPAGIVNDRWMPMRDLRAEMADNPALLNRIVAEVRSAHRAPPPPHYDVATPEYSESMPDDGGLWETVRGVGRSFGYNRAEGADAMLDHGQLAAMLARINAAGGNLLLNIAIRGDGTPCPLQLDRARALITSTKD